MTKWQKTKAEHDRHMEQLIATAKGSAIDPLIINCSFSQQKIATEAISYLDGILTTFHFIASIYFYIFLWQEFLL